MNSREGPKVSVIIPLFNQKQYIGEAIDSVLNQTYPNIEIIVVNDGSTDNPSLELKKFEKNIVLINQENKGLAAARNTGIRNSSGEYIQFLDADDFLHREKIKLQLEFSLLEDTEISYSEIAQYDNDSRHTHLRYVGEVKDMFSHLYNFWHTYPAPVHSLLIKRELFNKFGLFDEELTACEDRYLLCKFAAAKVDFKYFPFIGGFRRLHKDNMNKDRLHIVENTIRYYKKLNEELGERYFIEKFGYSGVQMMNANLTFMYFAYVREGTSRKELKQIKKLLSKEKLKFDAEPIPDGVTLFKLRTLVLASCLRRLLRFLYSHLFGGIK